MLHIKWYPMLLQYLQESILKIQLINQSFVQTETVFRTICNLQLICNMRGKTLHFHRVVEHKRGVLLFHMQIGPTKNKQKQLVLI